MPVVALRTSALWVEGGTLHGGEVAFFQVVVAVVLSGVLKNFRRVVVEVDY